MKTSILALAIALAFSFTTAALAATDEEKCQKKKLLALGKRDLCLQKERGKEVLGKVPNVARCAEKFDKQITAAERKFACRWLNNGNGTVTDLNTGLQWELKTDDWSIHDKDRSETWSDVDPYEDPNGRAFVDFLGTLNDGKLADGVTTECFADKCDWRLPTLEELAGIFDLGAPGCSDHAAPCTTIPGKTAQGAYWSSSTSTLNSERAWALNFRTGAHLDAGKEVDAHVRAVRGGS